MVRSIAGHISVSPEGAVRQLLVPAVDLSFFIVLNLVNTGCFELSQRFQKRTIAHQYFGIDAFTFP